MIFNEAEGLEIIVKYVYRELKQAANYLCKKGIERKSNGDVILNKHEKLKAILLGDENSIPYMRGRRSFQQNHGKPNKGENKYHPTWVKASEYKGQA